MNSDSTAAASSSKRDLGLDYTRILAFLLVVTVHFFLHSGFYGNAMQGEKMYIMTAIRTLCMSCVPLFLLLTGFLTRNNRTELTAKGYFSYLKKLRKILLTAVFCEAATGFYAFYRLKSISLSQFIINSVSFEHRGVENYGWYVEMYIGLFMLIPFLAILSRAFDKRAHGVCIAVLLFLTAAPSVFNAVKFSAFPQIISGGATQIFPDWWTNILYPVTYWFIGSYIGNYVDTKKLNTFRLAMLTVISTVIFSVFNIIKSRGKTFDGGFWDDYGAVENTVTSVLLFLLVNSINYRTHSKKYNSFIKLISELTFGAYLLSLISDKEYHIFLKARIPALGDRFWLLPVVTAASAVTALVLSFVVKLLVLLVERALDKIGEKMKGHKKDSLPV